MLSKRILIECNICKEKFILWDTFKIHAEYKHPLTETTAKEIYFNLGEGKEK